MRKRQCIKWIAGLLSAAILFTSEGMSCMVFASSGEPLSINASESGDENFSDGEPIPGENPKEGTSEDDSAGGEEEKGENPTPSDGQNPPPTDDTDKGNTEDAGQENPDSEEPDLTKPGEEETEKKEANEEEADAEGTGEEPADGETDDSEEVSADGEESEAQIPEEPDAAAAEAFPELSLSENSITLNSVTLSDESTPQLTDFQIVDEGGNVVENDTIRVKRGSARQLSVKPVPEGAVVDPAKVSWTSGNANISVENGKLSLKDTAPEGKVTGTVTVAVAVSEGSTDTGSAGTENTEETATTAVTEKTVTKSCTVEFLPVMTDFEIVDQDGKKIPETGITIVPGQQKKLGIKVLPEGAVAEAAPAWSGRYLSVNSGGVLTVPHAPKDLPCTTELTVTVRSSAGKLLKKTCKVTIQSPLEGEGLRLGDIVFSCAGMANPKKIDDTTWEADVDQGNGKMAYSLTYKGEETGYSIYYNNSSRAMTVNGTRISGGKRYGGSGNMLNPKYAFQVVIQKADKTCSDIYTVRFNCHSTVFTIAPTSINTIPNGAEQEIQVRRLPDGCELKDITWTSGDERIVKVKGPTEKGVMLQFGQSYGRTQITAAVNDFSGQTRYAVCNVNVSMKLPLPVFDSESGGEMYDEDKDAFYWLIDKGGKVSLSMKGVSKAQIYYTTNGSDPTVSGTLYHSPITINGTTTLKAYARLDGYQDSGVAESEFRIGNPKLAIPPKDSLKVTEGTAEKPVSKEISVTVPTGADPSFLTWESTDGDIARGSSEPKTNDEGDTTGYSHYISSGTKAGVCTLTASIVDYAGRTQTATCRVTVTGTMEIKPEKETLSEGETTAIMLTKIPRGISAGDVTWNISDPSVISKESLVNDKLTVRAKQLPNTSGPQIVSITASVDVGDSTISAGCQLTVNPKQYTVRFIGWKDKSAKEEKVFRGQNATPPDSSAMENAVPNGYTFKGWREQESAWKNIGADTEIHAVYGLQSYKITYNLSDADGANAGTNAGANPATYTVETKPSALILHDAVPRDSTKYKFAGWYLERDFSGSPIDEISAETARDLTLYAKWISAKTGLSIQPIADQPYTGKAVMPKVEVYDGDTLLILGTDYTVSYKNNTNAYMKPWKEPKKAPTVTVKGKGNYSGSDTETFQIVPQSIASEETEVVIPDLYLSHTGKKLTITPVVAWNGKNLRNKTDFEVKSVKKNNTAVAECIDEGDYVVTVSGKGNFDGERNIALTVTTKTLLKTASIKPNKLKDIPWESLQNKTLGEAGIQVDAGVVLKKGSDELKKGTDYTVTFDVNAKEIGTYTAIFTGIGEKYAGTVSKTFKITGTPLTAAKLDFGKDWKTSLTYNGTDNVELLKQNLKLSYKKDSSTLIAMTPDQDYTVKYDSTTNAGNKAALIITGINGYTGTVKKTFQITPYSLKDVSAATQITTSLAGGGDTAPYEKGGAKPKIIVKYGETVLTEGKDYTVSYKNNAKLASKDDAKAPSYTVKGKGNFKDSLPEKKFSITAQDISKLSITAEDVMAAAPNTKKGEKVGLTGKGKYKSTPKITDLNGKALAGGTDFLKTYTFTDENGVVLSKQDQVPAGSLLTVTVEGTKNYTGTTKVSYRVLAAKMSLKGASVSLKKGVIKTYALEPVVLRKEDLVVKLNSQELSGDNYKIVSYVNNRKKGTAKVTIQGVGEYGGQKTVNFNINARKIAWFKTT